MKVIYKYIIVKSGAILFNESTVHVQASHGFNEIFGAGFVLINFTTWEIKPFGESTSLNIKANAEVDEPIIRDLFTQMPKIKYFGFNVKEYYKEWGIEPLINKHGV